MGSFDSSCGISHIPVHNGERIVQIFLGSEAKMEEFSCVHFGGQWQPISFAIRGTYDDYGGIVVDESDRGQRAFDKVIFPQFSKVVRPTYRENKGDYSTFLDNIHCGVQPLPDEWGHGGKCEFREEVKMPSGVTVYELEKGNGSLTSKIFIHEDIYDKIIELGKQGEVSWKDKRPMSQLRSHVPEFIERRKTLLDELSDFDKELRANLLSFKTMRDGIIDYALTDYDSCSGGYFHQAVRQIILNDIDTFLLGDLDESASEELKVMFDQIIEMIWFKRGMQKINKALLPPAHLASQYQETDEALATLDFFEACKQVQTQKLINSFCGDDLLAYVDYGSEEYEKLRPIIPKNEREKWITDRAIQLVHTSVDDARSTISAWTDIEERDIEVLEETLMLLGDSQKTKVKMITAVVKRAKKELEINNA